METKHVVPILSQDPNEAGLKAERVQESLTVLTDGLELRLKAERVQTPQTVEAVEDTAYVYELAVNRSQPVSIELSGMAVTINLPSGPPGAA